VNLSVASVTVAYNAASVLPRQLDALLRQTPPLQGIVVVDNGSTDGTRATVAGRGSRMTPSGTHRNACTARAQASSLSSRI
jgi:glycosyltransferase involved in cell wall biosynthesis